MSDITTQQPVPADEPELDLTEPAVEDTGDDDGLEELEIGAEKHRVAKPIKEAWNGLQKTTQTEREALKAREAAIVSRETAAAENERSRAAIFEEISEIKSLDRQLEPYLKITLEQWTAAAEQDPAATQKAQVAMNALLMKRQQIFGSAQAKAQDLDQKARSTAAQRQADAEKALAAKIPDWSPAKRAAIVKAAVDNGFEADEVAPFLMDPRVISALDKAAKYDAAVARANAAKAAAANAKADGAPVPEPVIGRPKGNTASVRALRDSDPPDVWLKNREAHLKRAGKRI